MIHYQLSTVGDLNEELQRLLNTHSNIRDLPAFYEWEGQRIPIRLNDLRIEEVQYRNFHGLALVFDADS